MTLTAPLVTGRRVELDRLRGLAVGLMIVDHLAIAVDLSVLRVTVGRLAMPIFFILAGHLAGRVTVRHGYALGLGLALPVLAPWVDSPNVLVWFVVAAVAVWALNRLHVSPVVLPVVALAFAANGWAVLPGPHSYDPVALLGFMGLGACLHAGFFHRGQQLPAFLGTVGRYPLSWYVGHVLALQLVLVAAGRG